MRRRYLWLLDPEVFFGIIDPAYWLGSYAGATLTGGIGGSSRRHKLKAVLKVYRLVEVYPHTPDFNTAFTNAVRSDTTYDDPAFTNAVRSDTTYDDPAFTNAVRTDTLVFHSVT